MKLPEFGVKKPVTVLMIFTAMIVLGIISLPLLGLDLMPEIEIPVISVITAYQGAGPEEIENKISEPLEDSLSTVSSLDKIESVSREGVSTVTLKFDWGVDLSEAANDVRDKVALSKRFLPDEADEPIIFKFDFSMMPILIMVATADESYPVLYELIDEQICDPLKTIPGVAAAIIRGGLEREILVELDRSRLKAYHLSASQVLNVIKAENLSQPGGHLKTGQKDYLIRTPEELTVPEIEKIVVAVSKAGVPIYLKDIGIVRDSFKEETHGLEVNRKHGLAIMIQKQSGANTVEVVKKVLKKIETLKKNLPPDVELIIARDFSDFIKMSLGNLRNSLFWGGIFVVLVILFFLRNIRASLIVLCSIPTSLIVTFFLLYMGGYTLNIISLSSLAVAMGIVVDCAIVVLDSIYRHREKGHRPVEAAISGASEVSKAVIASTLTTVAIFVPIVFIGGISGIMFGQMAYCISLALLASLFTALVLIPMLSSKFLIVVGTNQKSWMPLRGFYKRSERWFVKTEEIYRKLLDWALSHRRRVILGTIIILVLSIFLMPFIKTRFMAEEDMGLFQIVLELPVGTRMEETARIARQIEDIIEKEVPEKEVMFAYWGMSSSSGMMGGEQGSNLGRVSARLSYQKDRKRSVFEIVDELRPLTSSFPGTKVRYITDTPLGTMLFGGGRPFSLEVYGHDLKASSRFAKRLVKELSKIDGLTDIEISREEKKPELQVIVDRDKASRLGLNVSDIGTTVETLFSGKIASRYREGGREYDILVRLKEEDRQKMSDLKNIFITSPSGRQIRLSSIARIEERLGPLKIERKNQQRVLRIMANISGRGLGAVVGEAEEVLKNIRIPKGFFISFGGEREEQKEAFNSLTIALLLGMFLVYMVMASQFESLRDPFIILFSIPFAMVGAIWALFITRQVFTVDTFTGLILLVGIVVNNAIVLISYINILRAKGLSVREAVTKGGSARLRPVLMTAATTIFALLPLALATGEGAESWRPFAITIIGGLLVSTLITLLFIPTLYSVFEEKIEKAATK